MPALDLSLYLVTGRELLPPGKDYYESLEESILGGVTVVQIREKNADTGEFLEVARKTKEICHRNNVPVIINDRIDIALAMGADGVHVGQSDMPAAEARRLLPKDAILGISVHTPEQAKKVVQEGLADYVGIGSVWPTNSKTTSIILGPRGVGPILDELTGSKVKAVAIGGLNSANVMRTLHGAVATKSGKSLDGIAVISAIVSSEQPRLAAQQLSQAISDINQHEVPRIIPISVKGHDILLDSAANILRLIKKHSPLIHQITNNVTINQLANASIALGASPIMATAPEEMADLSKIPGALLINFGTVRDKEAMLRAGRFANMERKPIVFDPVGIGATTFRKETGEELLNHWQATVIKGNAAEIGALAKSSEVLSKGVDSVGKGFSDPRAVVLELALRERCIVIMTGEADYISDGINVVSLQNGHHYLGSITGSGCMVGATVACFCGAASMEWKQQQSNAKGTVLAPGDMFSASIGGVLSLSIAAELAALREDVKGTGTFIAALIDELYNLTPETMVSRAKLQVL